MLQGYRGSKKEKVKVKERQKVQERWIRVVALKVISGCHFGEKETFWNKTEVTVAKHCECA